MDNDQILVELIDKLDNLAPKEGAFVKLQQYGGGPDESRIIANRTGYLRLGVEFLKAAFEEHVNKEGESPNAININLDKIVSEDSDIHFDWFERSEELPHEPDKQTSHFWVGLIISSIFVAFLILALVGLISIIKLIF